MKEDISKEIVEKVKENGIKSFKLTSGVKFYKEDSRTVNLELQVEHIMSKNMQDNFACFEGWSVIVYTHAYNKNVKIKISLNKTISEDTERTENWNRFLYRVYKFNEQYSWIELSNELTELCNNFIDFIKCNKTKNNIPMEDDASDNDKVENKEESRLSKQGELKETLKDVIDIGNNNAYRQLPVGLFLGDVKNDNAIFTKGHSAIDLWTFNEDKFYIVELKANNSMVGIITEIFFYCNYMKDLIETNGLFGINTEQTDCRGYKDLLNHINDIKFFEGIMLADKFHSAVTEDIVEVLNNNNSGINYYLATYKLSAN